MPTIIRVLVLGLLIVLQAGCGTKFSRDDLDQSELKQESRIGMLPINFLEKPSVDVHDNPLGLLGTAGKITVMKGKDTKRRKFASALATLKYSYQQQATEHLLERFEEAGMDVELIDFQRSIDNVLKAVPPRRFEKRYPDATGKHDLLLDIYIDYVGYSAASLGSDYLPTFHLCVRLVDAESHAVIYDAKIQYQSFDDAEEGVTAIEADPEYTYKNFDALMADLERAKEGLRLAVMTVVTKLIEEVDLY